MKDRATTHATNGYRVLLDTLGIKYLLPKIDKEMGSVLSLREKVRGDDKRRKVPNRP